MRPAACWFAALLVLWLGFTSASMGTEPRRPAPATDDLEIVYLAGARPIVLRAALHLEDRSLETRWTEYLHEWCAFLDRDGDGKLNEAEFRLAPSPHQVLQQWQAGLYPRLGEAGADFRAADTGRDASISSTEFAAYYRTGGVGPIHVVTKLESDPTHAALTAELFRLLDSNSDGKLSRAELRQASAVLMRLDVNDDELLTLGEILGYQHAQAVEPSSGPSPFFVRVPGRAHQAEQDALLGTALLRCFDRVKADVPALRRRPADAAFDVWLATAGGRCQVAGTKPSADATTASATALDARFTLRIVPGQPLLAEGVRQFYRQQFQQADRQHSGLLALGDIDRSRFSALFRIGSLADRDGDDRLTGDELDRCVELYTRSLQSHATVTLLGGRAGLFDLLDGDGDGRLSLRDFATAADRLLSWDRNRDGCLGKDEMPFFFQVVLSVGPPDRRALSAAPVAAPPLAAPHWFRQLDRNGDRYLSPREFPGSAEDFQRLDRDGDGLIGPTEAEAALEIFRKRPG